MLYLPLVLTVIVHLALLTILVRQARRSSSRWRVVLAVLTALVALDLLYVLVRRTL